MKGIPIKFRGCDFSGHTVCGDLVHGRTMGQTYIQILEHADLFDEGNARAVCIKVVPESVRQLIGFDCNGDEVYEGDEIVFENEIGLLTEVNRLQKRKIKAMLKPDVYLEGGDDYFSLSVAQKKNAEWLGGVKVGGN